VARLHDDSSKYTKNSLASVMAVSSGTKDSMNEAECNDVCISKLIYLFTINE
jgi:hypothetical protein